MKSYNILVFPCGTEVANEIINSLIDNKYFRLFFASSEKKSFCSFRAKEVEILPYVIEEKFIQKLNILIKDKDIDFIIPAHDDVLYELSLKEKFIKCKIVGQPFEINKIIRFKDKTYDLFKDNLPIPLIYNNFPKENDFPIFIKPKRGQGSFNAISLKNFEEFNSFFKVNKINEYVVMENLVGTEFTIDCFSNQGKLLYFGARTRDKTMKGITVVSSLVNNEQLNAEFEKYAKIISSKLNLNGIWFYQMKFDKNNQLKLLEIGARVSGSMILNRMRGINFVELAIYQKLGFPVKVCINPIDNISMGRALHSKFKIDIEYENLYIDFDDTLFLEEKYINTTLIQLIFQAKNKNKKVYLITKNSKNNLAKTLYQFGISYIFDDIFHLNKKEKKVDYMKEESILIDDSFQERREVIKKKKYAFGNDNIELLLK